MDIIFTCPHCDQKIEVSEIYAGTEILCPTCQNAIICPEPETQKVDCTPVKKTSVQNSLYSNPHKKTYKEPAPFNEVVYTLLGIFLGLFGTHNFYKRQYIAGIIRIAVIIVSIIILLISNQGYQAAFRIFSETTLNWQDAKEKYSTKQVSYTLTDKKEAVTYTLYDDKIKSEKLEKNIEKMTEARENMISILIFIILLQAISLLLVIVELGFQREHTIK